MDESQNHHTDRKQTDSEGTYDMIQFFFNSIKRKWFYVVKQSEQWLLMWWWLTGSYGRKTFYILIVVWVIQLYASNFIHMMHVLYMQITLKCT